MRMHGFASKLNASDFLPRMRGFCPVSCVESSIDPTFISCNIFSVVHALLEGNPMLCSLSIS